MGIWRNSAGRHRRIDIVIVAAPEELAFARLTWTGSRTLNRMLRYRAIHLARNKSYSQFIVGPDIAIITVHLQRARVCDVNDRVAHFAKQGEAWNEITQPSSPSGGSSPPRLS